MVISSALSPAAHLPLLVYGLEQSSIGVAGPALGELDQEDEAYPSQCCSEWHANVRGRLDGRSALARRYRDLVATFTSDMGGDPSEAEKQLIRRAESLSVWCEAVDDLPVGVRTQPSTASNEEAAQESTNVGM